MSNVSVSVIVPVYNGAAFLADALVSILSQSLRPQQIIVVDDGSTDGSSDVAHQFEKYVTLLQQPNLGASAARNRGVKRASGSHIAFLDADDVWVPDCLATQLECLRS